MDNKIELNKLDNEQAFKIIVDGKSVVCYIVLTFDSPETNKKYVVYTDGSKNEDGTLELLASQYDIVDGEIKLDTIETDTEWDMIDEMLAKVSENNE